MFKVIREEDRVCFEEMVNDCLNEGFEIIDTHFTCTESEYICTYNYVAYLIK